MSEDQPQKPAQPAEVKILEVRDRGSSIYIHWTVGDDDYPVTFHENPLPSFYEAVEGLKEHVVTLAEVPKADLAKIKTTGVTVRPKGENAMALITVQKSLKRNKRVINFTTPLLHMYPTEGADQTGADHMTAEEASAVEDVIREAKRYISGERAQGRLALEEKGKRGRKPKNGSAQDADAAAGLPGMEEPG